jgi:hypothetical protein
MVTALAKASISKKALVTSTLDLNTRKKPADCCILEDNLCGAGTWTVQKADQKYT